MTGQNLIEDYFEYQKTYQKKYGPQTIVLMQVGSFHEAYQTLDQGFELNRIGEILNFVVSKRNKSISTVDLKNPYMLGFPSPTLQKYLKILIEHLFTVVIIDQVTPPPNPKREITGIYSPGTYCEEISNPDSNNIISIYIEEIISNNSSIFIVGSSIVDITTGKTIVYESNSNNMDDKISLDDITKIIQSYSCKEYILTTYNLKTMPISKLISYLELNDKIYYHQTLDDVIKKQKNIQNIKYQVELFKKIYGSRFNNSNNIIEDINLERLNYGRLSLVIILNYIYDHNTKLINNLNIPEVLEKDNYMYLGNNAIYQLNIFNNDVTNVSNMFSQNIQYKSLFDVINKTSTAMGRRYLKNSLINPLLDIKKIIKRYDVIEQFITDNYWKDVEEMLNIVDIERLIRKISITQINPLDLNNCINGLKSASHLLNNVSLQIELLSCPKNKLIKDVNRMIQLFDITFNYDELSKYLLNDITGPIFKTGIFRDIDTIVDEINGCNNFIKSIATTLNTILNNKMPKKKTKRILDDDREKEGEEELIYIDYNENDGYYLCLTKRRSELLQQYLEDSNIIKIGNVNLNKDNMEFRSLKKGNTCKIFINEIQKKSDIIIKLTDELKTAIKEKYINWLINFYSKFQNTLADLIEYVCIIDFCKSGAKCAITNKYKRPTINNILNNKSYIEAENLRHPIAEKLLVDVEYVPTNIKLGLPNHEGVLLFGLNSVGKSTLQKSIGINIILAQIGYYVAATNFEYYPYKSLMTRITANDNLFRGLSSFALEINEINAILKRSNENTMIIADEVCKGTEHQSSLIIVMTMLEILSKNKCSFITATHLHDLTKMERLKKLSTIKLYHLHVDYDEKSNILKYDRKLLEGSGENFYGLNVAKCLINDNNFLNIANDIKLELYPNVLIGNKSSKYNSNLLVSKCQICDYYPKTEYDKPLETHHINFQKNTDKDGFILDKPALHKNHKSNLCVLCFKCHDKIDTTEIIITGYVDTSNGPKLDYIILDKKKIISNIKNNMNFLGKEISNSIKKYSNINYDLHQY